jgi:secreted Zn-dependent insulinase-like peptidase
MQQQWMKNLSFQWLIQGHLTESDALKMVEIAENAISSQPMNADDIVKRRCVKPQSMSVYEFNQINSDENVNNAIAVVFLDQAKDIDRRARITLMNSLLKEQVFN